MSKQKSKDKEEPVLIARELLVKVTELFQKSSVRTDSVVRNLIRGIAPGPNAFENASLAVAVLRNANYLNATNNSPTDSAGPTSTKGGKKKQLKKVEKDKAQSAQPKLRGFDRPLDVLFEDAVVRGAHPDKESHPAAKKLRELRADPNRVVKVQKLQAIFEEKNYANGKSSKVFRGLKKNADGDSIQDGPAVDMIVKDIRDFDLLAIEDEPMLRSLIEEARTELFSSETDFTDNPEGLKDAYPSLKGSGVLSAMLAGETDAATLRKDLAEAKFARFGPSKTLQFPQKGRYDLRDGA